MGLISESPTATRMFCSNCLFKVCTKPWHFCSDLNKFKWAHRKKATYLLRQVEKKRIRRVRVASTARLEERNGTSTAELKAPDNTVLYKKILEIWKPSLLLHGSSQIFIDLYITINFLWIGLNFSSYRVGVTTRRGYATELTLLMSLLFLNIYLLLRH